MIRLPALLLLSALACTPPAPDFYRRSTSAIGATIVVGPTCTIEQAALAANTNAAVGGCSAGSPVDQDVIQIPAGSYAPGLRITANEDVAIVGDANSWPVIDMGGRDRFLLVQNGASTPDVEVANVLIRNGCANGFAAAACNVVAGGSAPNGGAVYFNAPGSLLMHDFRIESSSAQQGGGIAVCAGSVTGVLIEDGAIAGSSALAEGGGALAAHVDLVLRNLELTNNRARNGGRGGSVRIYGGHAVIEGSTIVGGTSEAAEGGNIAVDGQGAQNPSALPVIVEVVGGVISGGVANGSGGNAFVQAGAGGAGVANRYCPAGGCSLILRDVAVTGGAADSPLGWPQGDGGNAFANLTSSAPGRIELRGATILSGGTDSSATARPDCNAVDAYDSATIANPVGCAVTQHGPPPPVCGNGAVEGQEECDDGNAASGDGCSAACAVETCVEVCVDYHTVCT